MIGQLNHVAIAVPDLDAATATYRDQLGAIVSAPEALPEHGVTVVFITLPNTKIELLHPLGEHSPIQGFLDKHPKGGMHHLCYEVDDIIAHARGSNNDKPGSCQAAVRARRRTNSAAATMPKLAVTMVEAPKPDAQSSLPGEASRGRCCCTLPSGCGWRTGSSE